MRCSASARWPCSTPAATTTTPRSCSSATAISTCNVVRHPWGIRLQIKNAPAGAFVDGQMIRGIKEHLFAVLRDVVFIVHEVHSGSRFDLDNTTDITNAVFHVLRNARLLDRRIKPNLVVCWGGHSISEQEYKYTKKVGYELGLRVHGRVHRLRSGRHEGADEGRDHRSCQAAHFQRPLHRPHRARHHRRRAAERHRQPAGHHAGHREAPGGLRPAGAWRRGVPWRCGHHRGNPVPAGHPARSAQRGPGRCPWCSPARSRAKAISSRSGASSRALPAPAALERLRFIVDDPAAVARQLVSDVSRVRTRRRASNDSYSFNWLLRVPEEFQHPFVVTHESMRRLRTAPRPAPPPADRQPAPRLLRHRRRQRQGAGHRSDRGAWALRALRRSGSHAAARRAAAGLRGRRAHEAAWQRVYALLPHRFVIHRRGRPRSRSRRSTSGVSALNSGAAPHCAEPLWRLARATLQHRGGWRGLGVRTLRAS